jgi:hypothetical protein
MFRTLLTPLSSRFSATFPNTPHTVNEEDDGSPEDFARDVLIELMRNSITKLKDAEDVCARLAVLEEILRVAQQDACTKDVFREMDGFLVLINLFTTVDIGQPPTEQVLEQLRLAFAILSTVLKQHTINMDYFRVSWSRNECLSLLIIHGTDSFASDMNLFSEHCLHLSYLHLHNCKLWVCYSPSQCRISPCRITTSQVDRTYLRYKRTWTLSVSLEAFECFGIPLQLFLLNPGMPLCRLSNTSRRSPFVTAQS